MAQLYNPTFSRLIRSLLLQCVFMLGLVSTLMAQIPTTNTTVTYNGPWFGSNQGGNITSNRLVADGGNLAPSTTGGSAQLRYVDSHVDVKLQNVGSIGLTGYKISYSLSATTTRSSYEAKVRVSYLLDGNGTTYTQGELVTVPLASTTTPELRSSLYLPNNATNVRFQLEEVSNAYVFLDAITVSQEPEITGFTLAQGLPKDVITINGKLLTEATQVYFGDVLASAPFDIEDEELKVTVPYGVKTDKITVVNPYGFAISENEFTVPVPVFDATLAFDPIAGAPGETVTIYGQNLIGVNQVLFNNVAADPKTIEFEEETENTIITVTVPLGATSGPITLASPAGSSAPSAISFTVFKPEIIAQAQGEPSMEYEFYPDNGSAGDPITIYGRYFLAVTDVQFNNVSAEFDIVDDNTITVIVPLRASTGKIKLVAPAGDAVSEDDFNVPAPKFAEYDEINEKFQFMPNTAGPGLQIKLFGANLSSVSTVLFTGGAEGVITPATKDDELIVTVPDDAETGVITIIAPGTGKQDISVQEFIFVPTPIIASVEAVSGGAVYGIVRSEGAADVVTITGENFQTAEQLVFGSTTIAVYNETTNLNGFEVNEAGTAITFPLVAGMATGSITVKTKGGEANSEDALEVIYQPSNISFTPKEGPLGREITITGKYLKYVSEVTFLGSEGETAQTVELDTPNTEDDKLVVTVPAGTTTGLLSLTNPAGTTITADEYEVILIPVITAFNPTEGIVGDEITIEGYNFTGTTTVSIGASEVIGAYDADSNPNGFKIASDTELAVRIPADATTGLITITNGVGPGVSKTEFEIIQLPTITAVSPLKGVADETVTITGTNFYGGNLVVTFLGGTEGDEQTAEIISVDNDDETHQLTVTVPNGAVTGKLMVTNAAGNSIASTDIYEIVTSPEIVNVNPTEGVVSQVITITGWLLDEVTTIEFNGTTATPITEGRTAKSLTVAVPLGATTGPLALMVNGDNVFTTEEDFIVIPAPTITLVEKDGSGVAGTPVTITGTNLADVTTVTFLGTTAAGDDVVLKTNDFTVNEEGTVITTTVPYAAVTGKIQVTSVAGTGISPEDFIVPIPVITSVLPATNTSYANELVTISGYHFKNMTRLTFNGKPSDITDVEPVVDEDGLETIIVGAPKDAGTGLIALTTPAGVGNSPAAYTVIEPVITSISVYEGYAEKTTVTISGTDFMTYYNVEEEAVKSDATPIVRFNGTLATIVGTPTNTSIIVEVPVGATSGSISVESPSGIGYSDNFKILLPIITKIEVGGVVTTSAYAYQTVTITGDNFVDILGLTFKGAPVAMLSKVENETGGVITFVAPFTEDAGDTGTGNLIIRTKTGSSAARNNFTVIKPSITSIIPNRVYAGVEGSQVTITGANFMGYYDTDNNQVSQAKPTVRFSGDNATDAEVVSATETQLVVKVPQYAATGDVTIRSGSGVRTESTVTIIGAPSIREDNPFVASSGTAGTPEFTSFVIHGSNLDQATKVEFLGTTASGDEVVMTSGFTANPEGTQISLSVPAGAVAGPIAVTTPYNKGVNGVGTTVPSSTNFRVVNAPTITSIVATDGAVGTTIKINGTNLWDVMGTGNTLGKAQVFFKTHNPAFDIPNKEAEKLEIAGTVGNFDDVWGTWLEVTIPANAISGAIRVQNVVSSVTSPEAFEVTTPMIVNFEKDVDNSVITSNNAARLLEKVIVRGYKLREVGTIRIGTEPNSTRVTSFFEEGENELEMFVPRGATTDKVAITSTGGEEVSDTDLYIDQPVIRLVRNGQDITKLDLMVKPGEKIAQSYIVIAESLAFGETEFTVTLNNPGNSPFRMSLTGDADSYIGTSYSFAVNTSTGNIEQQEIWVQFAPTTEVISSSTITHSAIVTNRSQDLTLNGDAVTPLPVELIAFNARKEGNAVQLTWATASEQDNDYFEVQMTEDLKGEFKAVGQVKSKVNTTALRQDYQFNHKGNFNGTRYYRLKQVDLDGSFEYSKVVAVSSNGVNLAVGPRVFPNPINADSKLVYNADRAGKLNLRIVNMNGSAVQDLSYDIEEGENTILLNLNNNLPTGIYILMTEFNGKTEQVKLMKQ